MSDTRVDRESVERVARFCEETAQNWDDQTNAVWGAIGVHAPHDSDRDEYEYDVASSQPMKNAAALLRALLARAEAAERERDEARAELKNLQVLVGRHGSRGICY